MIINTERLNLYLSILSLTIISVYLICAFYAVPSADDYFYANLVRDHGLLAAQTRHYIEWSGRYTATFLITLFSMTAYQYYWLVPWACIIFLLFAFYFFLSTVFYTLRDTIDLRLSALAFMALYLSIATAGFSTAGLDHGVAVINEGFFWFSGAITYSGSLSLYLVLVALLLQQTRQKSTVKYVGTLLISPVLIGLNETAMMTVVITVAVFVFLHFRRLGAVKALLLLTTVLSCSALVFLAPGNEARMQTSDGGRILSALGICVEKIVQILFFYLANPFLWLFVIVFRKTIHEMAGYLIQAFGRKRLYLSGIVLVYILFFPVAYSLNAGPPDRLIAFIGPFALVASLIYSLDLYEWFISRGLSEKKLVSLLLVAAIAGGYFFIEPLRIGVTTLFTGHKFYAMHNQRIARVKDDSRKGMVSVDVAPITRNRLLLFEDLAPDTDNAQFARFYGVQAVHLGNQPKK